MRIVCLNLNGIRAALRKGLGEWAAAEPADIYCFQETKIDASLVAEIGAQFPGYEAHFACAEKKGYSGVAVLTRVPPKAVTVGIGTPEFDAEGRVLRVDFDGFTLVNMYYPSGSTGDARQAVKEAFMAESKRYLTDLLAVQPNVVHCGDFNICHKDIDIHHPERHQGVSGFLPHERQWMTDVLALGLTDSFRHVNQEPDHYSWWTYRAGAKDKNLGWRIDYHLVSSALTPAIVDHQLRPEFGFSDHCPLVLTLSD